MKYLLQRKFTLCAVLLLVVGSTGCRHASTTDSPATLRVMTYNIHHGRGVDGKVDLERIAALIREQDVDLVALQEVDKGTTRTDGIDIATELGRLTGMKPVFSRNIEFQGGEYGNAILSRHPVVQHSNLHYQMLRDGEQRGLLSAEVDLGTRHIMFASTHLDHRPDPSERISNVREIESFARNAKFPLILAGDFNDHPDKPVHSALTEFLVDAWERAGVGTGFTYSSTEPKSRIDYVFLFPAGQWEVAGAEVLTTEASDHLPLVVELGWTN